MTLDVLMAGPMVMLQKAAAPMVLAPIVGMPAVSAGI